MSEGTFVGDIIGAVTAPFHSPPKPPTLAPPNALSQTPTQADASKDASKKNLETEQQAASTSTVLTSGQGLLDTPSTTSRTLTGY